MAVREEALLFLQYALATFGELIDRYGEEMVKDALMCPPEDKDEVFELLLALLGRR